MAEPGKVIYSPDYRSEKQKLPAVFHDLLGEQMTKDVNRALAAQAPAVEADDADRLFAAAVKALRIRARKRTGYEHTGPAATREEEIARQERILIEAAKEEREARRVMDTALKLPTPIPLLRFMTGYDKACEAFNTALTRLMEFDEEEGT